MSDHCQQLAAQLCHCITAWFCATGMWNEYEGELCTFSVLVWLSNVTWVSAVGDIIVRERKTSKAGGTVGAALPR